MPQNPDPHPRDRRLEAHHACADTLQITNAQYRTAIGTLR